MRERSSFSGELAIGQVWADRSGRQWRVEDRRVVGDPDVPTDVTVEYRISDNATDYGRWIDARNLVVDMTRVESD